LFLGTMDYLPNVDAVEYFAENIFPKVRESYPKFTFVVAGRDPSRRVRRLGKLPGVVVTGTVPDVEIYLSGAAVVVAPFRIARGIQSKLLQALAAGKPVVSTSGPAAAIGARHGDTLLIADTPNEFAHALLALLSDHELYARLSNGAGFVRRNFDWMQNLSRLEQLLEKAAYSAPEAEALIEHRAGAS
jgi:glycosyltransferase involved in cell wall biosynthesis